MESPWIATFHVLCVDALRKIPPHQRFVIRIRSPNDHIFGQKVVVDRWASEAAIKSLGEDHIGLPTLLGSAGLIG